MPKVVRLLAGVGIGSMLVSAQQVSAQPVAEGASDIVVTAQRRSQRLQDVPVSVAVVGGEALEKANIKTLSDVSSRLPGVRISEGPAADLLNIRGVGSGQNSGFEQSVATFVDGVYRGRGRAIRAALFDVERIEVLKGPQSTFFGNNAIAGAFNITTRKPGDALSYNASALATPRGGEFNLEGGLSVPLSETLAVRVAGRYSGQDGFVRNDFLNRDEARIRDKQGRIAIRWNPVESFTSNFRFDVGSSRQRGAMPFEIEGCPATGIAYAPGDTCLAYLATGGASDGRFNNRASLPESFFNYNFKEAAWSNEVDVGSLTLTSITSYFKHRSDQLAQLIPIGLRYSNGAGLVPSAQQENYRQYTQEVRLQSETGGTFEYMAGLYYSNGKLRLPLQIAFNSLPYGAPFFPFSVFTAPYFVPGSSVGGIIDVRQKDETRSAFASATIRPVDRLRINLGLRYSEVEKTARRLMHLGTFTPDLDPDKFVPFAPAIETSYNAIFSISLADFPRNKRTDKKWQPSIGVQYDLTPDVMTYATFNKGFKAGGFAGTSTGEIFEPETVKSYEVGVKSSLFDRRVTLNLAGFWMDYSNLQESTFINNNGVVLGVVGNAAEARSRGVELGASWQASPALNFSTDLTYLDAYYTTYPVGACTLAQQAQTPQGAPCAQDLSGKDRPFAPRWSGNVTANLTVPFSTVELRLSPTIYFTSKFFQTASADPALQQDGYAKVDLRAAIGPADQSWELAVIGKNLTDRTTASFRNAMSGTNNGIWGLTERPRTVSIQFSIRR